jgi:hypothetical protein
LQQELAHEGHPTMRASARQEGDAIPLRAPRMAIVPKKQSFTVSKFNEKGAFPRRNCMP